MTINLNPLRKIKQSLIRYLKQLGLSASKASVPLIVIGAQKGGTTALFNYLAIHPDISAPDNKEINFFYASNFAQLKKNDYLEHFPSSLKPNQKIVSIDVSPNYMLDANVCAKNIFHLNPKANIVALLRDPNERAISAWFMYQKLFNDDPDWFLKSEWVQKNNSIVVIKRKKQFGQNLLDDLYEEVKAFEQGKRIEYPILEYGLYAQQLNYFFDLFNSKKILVLNSSDLKEKPQETLNNIYDHMGLARHTYKHDDLIPHFVGDNKQQVPKECVDFLSDFYSQKNKDLNTLLDGHGNWRGGFK